MTTHIKELSREKMMARSTVIKYRIGDNLRNREQVHERWRKSSEELYSYQRGDIPGL